ncbi:hypothetical protein [uncultured Mediterranean phage]|nr:hypothetical protein [uncultured Mediterranean phage]
MAAKKPAAGQIWANADGSDRVKILKVNKATFRVRKPDGKTSTVKTLAKRVYIKG